MTPDPRAAPDPGLAEERTELARRRTAIAVTALGGALVKAHPGVGIPALALGAVAWWLGHRTGARHPFLTTVAVIAVSAMTLVTVLLNA